MFQSSLLQLVNTEKLYNNIQYLTQKTSSKVIYETREYLNKEELTFRRSDLGNEIYLTILYFKDKYYEPIVNNLEQIIKDGNTSNLPAHQVAGKSFQTLDINNFLELIAQLLQFTDFRLQMMNMYVHYLSRNLPIK